MDTRGPGVGGGDGGGGGTDTVGGGVGLGSFCGPGGAGPKQLQVTRPV